MQNYQDTILSQYANSPTIFGLIQNFNDCVDPSADIQAFYDNIWNIETAVGYGLDVWGKIVGVSRSLQVVTTGDYFGFHEAFASVGTLGLGLLGSMVLGTSSVTELSPTVTPFGDEPFYNGPPATSTYLLADDAYRKLIMVKAMANIGNGSVPSLNALLQYLFSGEGKTYVQDTGSMEIRFVFEFILSPVEEAIMLSSRVIPRPAGVRASVMQVDPLGTFSFAEADGVTFADGTFFNSTGLQNAS